MTLQAALDCDKFSGFLCFLITLAALKRTAQVICRIPIGLTFCSWLDIRRLWTIGTNNMEAHGTLVTSCQGCMVGSIRGLWLFCWPYSTVRFLHSKVILAAPLSGLCSLEGSLSSEPTTRGQELTRREGQHSLFAFFLHGRCVYCLPFIQLSIYIRCTCGYLFYTLR